MTFPGDLIQAGVTPFRDHRRTLRPERRNVSGGARVVADGAEVEFVEIGDALTWAFWPPSEPVAGSDEEPTGDSLQPSDKPQERIEAAPEGREIGAWSMAWPAVHQEPGLKPVYEGDEADERFEPLELASDYEPTVRPKRGGSVVADPPENGGGEDDEQAVHVARMREVPRKTPGILLAGTREDAQQPWFVPAHELVAQHRGKEAPRYATPVHEIDEEGALDESRQASLHTHLRVADLGAEDYGLAWNLGEARETLGGLGSCHGPGDGGGETVAYGSWLRGGPFHPGAAVGDAHRFGENADGEAVNPLHLWTEALFYRDPLRDGPLEFLSQDYIPGQVWPEPTQVWLLWDRGVRRWRWLTTVPFQSPVPPFEPPTDIPPPVDGPLDRPVEWPPPGPGAPGGGPAPGGPAPGGPAPGGPAPGGPGPGEDPADPGEAPGGPGHPPGGTGVPGLYPPPPRPLADPWGLDERGHIPPIDPHGLPGSRARYGPLQLTPKRPLAPMRSPYEISAPSLTLDAIRAPQLQPYDGRYGPAEALPRDPATGELSRAPHVAHLAGIGRVREDGRFDYTTPSPHEDPGEARFAAGTASGVLLLAPPEYLPDADPPAQPGLLSSLELGLYDGHAGGEAVALAWGRESFQQGRVHGGPVLTPAGAPGEADLVLGFRDATGETRAGRFGINTDLPQDTLDVRGGSEPAVRLGEDVRLARVAADTLELAAGDRFRPATTGQWLGEEESRWSLCSQSLDVAGAALFAQPLEASGITLPAQGGNPGTPSEATLWREASTTRAHLGEAVLDRPWMRVVHVTESSTVEAGDLVVAQPADTDVTVYLPPLSAELVGMAITVKRTPSGNGEVLLAAAQGDEIDGDTVYMLATPGAAVTLWAADTTNWYLA